MSKFVVVSPMFTLGSPGDVVEIGPDDGINTRALVRCKILAEFVEPEPEPPTPKRSKAALKGDDA